MRHHPRIEGFKFEAVAPEDIPDGGWGSGIGEPGRYEVILREFLDSGLAAAKMDWAGEHDRASAERVAASLQTTSHKLKFRDDIKVVRRLTGVFLVRKTAPADTGDDIFDDDPPA